MGVYEDLKARGLIAQVTDEEQVRELVNSGKAIFYIGFDPTADSLHVGHFMGAYAYEKASGSGQQTDCAYRRRHRHDRRSERQNRYASNAYKRNN